MYELTPQILPPSLLPLLLLLLLPKQNERYKGIAKENNGGERRTPVSSPTKHAHITTTRRYQTITALFHLNIQCDTMLRSPDNMTVTDGSDKEGTNIRMDEY
uniref:Secreted protein n=1 Tax=Loa loa TaxID=7209 RepID=A0A1I7VLW8_LOALO